MTIRELDILDMSSINSLLFQLTESEYTTTANEFKAIIIRENIIQLYAYSSDNISKVVGLLTLVIFFTPSGSHARIEDVVVDKEFRGQHIGRELTKLAIDKALEFKIKEVDLTSSPHRVTANNLYQNMGFEKRDTNVYRYINED